MGNLINASIRNDINYINGKVSNWAVLPESLKKKILLTNNWWIDGSQALIYYIDDKAVISCGITIDSEESLIEIESAGCDDGFQWNGSM